MSQPTPLDGRSPEYYADLLKKPFRFADRHQSIDEQFYRDIPGIQGVDNPLSRRLQALLDVLAGISLDARGNVSATMASLKDNSGTLETKLYLVFNHDLGDKREGCRNHLEDVFNTLRGVPYELPTTDGSPKFIVDSLETHLIDFCQKIHNYSFGIFAYRVAKRKSSLPEIRRYIELDEHDEKYFTPQERSELMEFFRHVGKIIERVDAAQATKALDTDFIRALLDTCSYWKMQNLLPRDPLAEDRPTLLDRVDVWIDRKSKPRISSRLGRWARKIMSFVISANRLFTLTQSNRLRNIILGNLSIQFLPSPTAAPYSCDLSPETVRRALDAALAGSEYDSSMYKNEREKFVDELARLNVPGVAHHYNFSVHAELAMAMAMIRGEIPHAIPYIGVSKLSCVMCRQYFRSLDKVMDRTIYTRGSHGKPYPGWSWPTAPTHNKKLRKHFFKGDQEPIT